MSDALKAAAQLIEGDRRNLASLRFRRIPPDSDELAAAAVRAYLDALDPAEVLVDVNTEYDSTDAVVSAVLWAVRP